MINEIRHNLDKVTGELIESFVKFDKNKAIQLKAGLHAIHNAQKNKAPEQRVNLYTVRDYDLLHNLLEEHGISRQHFEKLPEFIESKQAHGEFASLPEPLQEAVLEIGQAGHLYEVPASGMVAVMFDLVSDKVKNALVAGQAGERTLRAIERASTVSHLPMTKEFLLKDTLYDYGNQQRLARPYIGNIGNEPDYLISAKATHHLADLFEGSIRLDPAILGLATTGKSIAGFRKLAAYIFKHASDSLDKAHANEASEKIGILAKHFNDAGEEVQNIDEACAAIDSSFAHIKESLLQSGIINASESQDYESLVKQRIAQVKKMEVAF